MAVKAQEVTGNEFNTEKLKIATEIFRLESEKEKLKKQMADAAKGFRDTMSQINERISEKRIEFARDYIEVSLFQGDGR